MTEKQQAARDRAVEMFRRVADTISPKLASDARLGMTTQRDVYACIDAAVDATIAAATPDPET